MFTSLAVGRYHFPEAVFVSDNPGKPKYTNQTSPRSLITCTLLPAALPGHRQLPHNCAGKSRNAVTGINLILVSWAFLARLLHQFCINYTCYRKKHTTRLISG